MRTIKFRGKSIFDGRWVYGLLRMRKEMKHAIIEELNGLGHDVDKETVGQYTDLKDKNGKEIYEGDVVTDNNSYGLDKKEVCFIGGGFYPFTEQYDYSQVKSEDFEVIDNIYENPELLKGQGKESK